MQKVAIKSRRSAPAWLLALLLAFAVSVWGLHYKLSLYDAPVIHAHGPDAKLLSQKERPVASAQPERVVAAGKPIAARQHPTVAHALAAFIVVALVGTLPERRLLCGSQDGPHRLPLAPSRPSAPRAPPITA